ncbi:MAG TPA: hypothetical protein V6D47_18955 [Oscillatoriaceae cyanobacterium]
MSRRLLPPLLLFALCIVGCAIQLPSVPILASSGGTLASTPRIEDKLTPNQGKVSTLALNTDHIVNFATDDQDNLYLVTLSGVDKVTPSGKRMHIIDSVEDFREGADNPATVTNLEAIAVAHDGTMYLWGDAGRVYIRTPAGKFSSVLVGKHYSYVPNLAVDAQGNVYVSVNPSNVLPGDHQIVKVTPQGDVSVYAGRKDGGPGYADGPADQALFNQPGALAFDGEGNLYVADMGNQAIRRITPDGNVSTVVAWEGGTRWGTPGDASDVAADVPFGPPAINTAPWFSPTPIQSSRPSPPAPVGSNWYLGLTVDRAGNLYFTANDNRIHRLTPDGSLSVFAGDGKQCLEDPVCDDGSEPCASPDPKACHKDGLAMQAEFAQIRGMVANSQGVLYVLDAATGHSYVRVIR